ncbi:hypothetical protein PGT21_022412 [Puccinia graminis f. sp. tritici]|uniref:Retrotransposon gag domain-containing protein n=1 Tax=Puccinia graminis f. sp. tritici TaxID=56615 RepID=A0A5B0QWS9_PUCGR|nr:hypothetical protein PGT21_022412 [Puccinia graminis f. sp. tritici]
MGNFCFGLARRPVCAAPLTVYGLSVEIRFRLKNTYSLQSAAKLSDTSEESHQRFCPAQETPDATEQPTSVTTSSSSGPSVWNITRRPHNSFPLLTQFPPHSSQNPSLQPHLPVRRGFRPRSMASEATGQAGGHQIAVNGERQQQPQVHHPPGLPQDDRVNILSQEVLGLKNNIAEMVAMMQALAARSSPIQADNDRQLPPHMNPSQPGTQQYPQQEPIQVPAFDAQSRMEPLKIPDLWFSGDSQQLLSFLRAIRDYLRARSACFDSDNRRIIWISRHFGYGSSGQWKNTAPSPAENWYTSLINDNARRQGPFNPYGDLDGIKFTIPSLLSTEAFLEALIGVFGDRFIKENAKRALAACKQGQSTIGDYNSRFSSLVYLVEDVEEARIERYVLGLNPRIIYKAMSKEWRGAKTLDERMELATEAAAQLDLLSLLPSESSQPRHQPLSSAPPPGLSLPTHHQTTAARDPNAMDVDAAFVRRGNRPQSLIDIARSICLQKSLCFRCLQPTSPPTHTGSLDCPNMGVTTKQREAFVARHRPSSSTPVSAIQVPEVTDPYNPLPQPPLTYRSSEDPTLPPPATTSIQDVVTERVSAPVSYQGFDEEYAEYDQAACATADVPVSTVHVQLDCSKKGRLLVPLAFRGPDGV